MLAGGMVSVSGMSLARFVTVILALVGLAASPRAGAESKVHRLGILSVSIRSVELTRIATLPVLEKLGFVEGRNLAVVSRVGTAEQLPVLARELLAEKSDVILVVGWEAIGAARAATFTVPLVIFGPDPVRLGFAESLARPGGNVTGVLILATELDGKRLQLLHEAVPKAKRIAALVRKGSPNRAGSDRDMRAVAAGAGFQLGFFEVSKAQDYSPVFQAMRGAGTEALAIVADPEFFRDGAELVRLAGEARFPTVCQWSEMAAAGCMLSYGPSLIALRRRIAEYIARIFDGAKPGELPIEQPSKVEFIVNLKTARALGVRIPEAVLLRADQIIE